ncbi:MAG: M23 family metallopeptidase, partial [Rhizobiaceae bacterium]|nr:M23 family metallopeptidase [Rhizobiaceae bacterium]
ELTADEVEQVVRTTGSVLTDGAVQVAALHYVDPQRFGQASLAVQTLGASYGVRIVPENVTVAPRLESDGLTTEFAEDIIPFRADREIMDAFLDSGYAKDDVEGMVQALATLLGGSRLRAGAVLRVGIETRGDQSRIMRSSIYNGENHLLSIAVDDRGQFVPGDEPELNPEILTAFDDSPPVHVRGDLPSVYDGIYRAAYSYGLTKDMTKQMIKLLASDVDYKSRLNPSDRIEVFFSNPLEDGGASDDSEMLYLAATFNGTARAFYRFQMEDGTIDYFDKDGRSARQFLLRSPVPGARLSRGFGMMRHPILGYSKMHTGVDWAIGNGTPIIAAGNGVVEEAGWSGGYGRHTVIRHANGYETSYSHQSAIAKGVTEGARVRQGQIIGYVGSSGLSTGNHLHYELIVNGTKVDPMRVRLPVGRVLKDHEMEVFTRERERIDELLIEDNSPPLKVAAAG